MTAPTSTYPTHATVQSKRCSNCREVKTAEKFYRSLKAHCGLQAWCINCHKTKPRKREVVKLECEKCHLMFARAAKPLYKEVLRRKVCIRCSNLEKMAKRGQLSASYTGTRHLSGKLIAQWKLSAARRSHEWNISNFELDGIYESQGGICALSGMKMIWSGPPAYRPSIDRKDSSGSYCAGNIQFVCSVVNIMKNKISETEFVRVCALVAGHRMDLAVAAE